MAELPKETFGSSAFFIERASLEGVAPRGKLKREAKEALIMCETSTSLSEVKALRSAHRVFLTVLAVLLFVSFSFVGKIGAIDSMPVQAKVYEAIYRDVSPPLRDILPLPPQAGFHEIPLLPIPHNRQVSAADPVLQILAGPLVSTTSPNSFAGLGLGFPGFTVQYIPPDTNGAAGETQYVQWVNASFAVFDKSTGTVVYGPADGNTLWSGFGGPCQNNNSGDPIAQFDKVAGRWVMMQPVFRHPYYVCVAVSTSSDAAGSYYRYAFPVSNFPDYPKLGVWPDGYYISFNQFKGNSFLGAAVCALDRDSMLFGNPATMQCFTLGSAYGGLLPSDLDGLTMPPDGSPDFVLNFGNNSLNLWKFHVDFNNAANSTFVGPVSLPVAPFTEACGGGSCIPQSGTSQLLDSLGDRLMYRLAYRNFGPNESLVLNHSVDTGNGNTGIRWYEIRDPNGTPAVYQEGTYAPDSNYRWMGSIAMDNVGNIALGYSVSGDSMHPAIRYTGRVPGDPSGVMEGEQTIVDGTGSQTNYNRWGDYSGMTVDPMDDCTFWYTTEYLQTTGYYWSTRIASFNFPSSCPGNTYSIAGTVAVPGVTMALNGAGSGTVTSDAGGNYSFSGLSDGGTYSVTPIAAGYTFTPSTITVTVNGGNAIGQNFAATALTNATYSISGTVATSGGSALAGVTITLSGAASGTTTTDANGNYNFGGLANGSYTITPSLTGYTFSPAYLTVSISDGDVAGENFTGTANSGTGFSISGTVATSGGSPIGGVTVTLTGVTTGSTNTNGRGTYSFTGLANGTYTITPIKNRYTFSPTSITLNINGADWTGQNFTGTRH
jgi:Carboxypeptidase regulatory-like domain